MTKEELREIIAINENYRIELTISTGDMDKFQEPICAFANDMPGSRKKGYLLIGVKNNGQIDGLKVDDALMKKISGIRSDGNILPLPVMSTEKVVTEDGDVLELLKENDSPAAEFNVSYLTAFSVIIREPDESSLPKLAQVDGKTLSAENQEVMNKLFQAFPNFGKAHAQVITTTLNTCKSPSLVKDVMAACNISSRTTFDRVYFGPIKELGLILPIYPDNPRHPQQKYYLTEIGLEVLKLLDNNERETGGDV